MMYNRTPIYNLLKNIKPIWYFNLLPKNKKCFNLTDYEKMVFDQKEVIDFDDGYTDKVIANLDLYFQAINRGVINIKSIDII